MIVPDTSASDRERPPSDRGPPLGRHQQLVGGRRDGTSATWVKADDRYGGARPRQQMARFNMTLQMSLSFYNNNYISYHITYIISFGRIVNLTMHIWYSSS